MIILKIDEFSLHERLLKSTTVRQIILRSETLLLCE